MDGAPILNGGENAALYRFWVGSFFNRQSYPIKKFHPDINRLIGCQLFIKSCRECQCRSLKCF